MDWIEIKSDADFPVMKINVATETVLVFDGKNTYFAYALDNNDFEGVLWFLDSGTGVDREIEGVTHWLALKDPSGKPIKTQSSWIIGEDHL